MKIAVVVLNGIPGIGSDLSAKSHCHYPDSLQWISIEQLSIREVSLFHLQKKILVTSPSYNMIKSHLKDGSADCQILDDHQ